MGFLCDLATATVAEAPTTVPLDGSSSPNPFR
jgi:hypothetical protein